MNKSIFNDMVLAEISDDRYVPVNLRPDMWRELGRSYGEYVGRVLYFWSFRMHENEDRTCVENSTRFYLTASEVRNKQTNGAWFETMLA